MEVGVLFSQNNKSILNGRMIYYNKYKKAASKEEYLSMQNFHFIDLSSLHYLASHVV